jgi:hypothetical protein
MVGRDGRKMVKAICEDTVALMSSQIGGLVVRIRGKSHVSATGGVAGS